MGKASVGGDVSFLTIRAFMRMTKLVMDERRRPPLSDQILITPSGATMRLGSLAVFMRSFAHWPRR